MTSKQDASGACPNLETCPMFSTFESAAAGKIFKKLYCEGNYSKCARFERSSKGLSVAITLLPNGSELRV